MEIAAKLKIEVNQMYEVTFIINPDLSEDENKKLVSKFQKVIKDGGGEIINHENWGKKRLAYPIGKKQSGYYTFIEFKGPGTIVPKLEQEFIYDENVIRYLTVRLDKHAVAYNIKRRDKLSSKKAEA